MHRQITSSTRRFAAASVAAASVAVLTPGLASAVQVTVPGTDISFDVPELDQIQGLENIPGAEQWISQSSTAVDLPAAPVSAPVQAVVAATPVASVSTGQAIVDAARSKIGAPYAWGATGPNAFDCSGLTTWAYQQAGKSIPRTSGAQAAQGTRVPLDQLQPGDIIAYYSGASHVGIYTGNGTIIDALNSGTPVAERDLHYMPIHSAVRF